MSVQLLAIKFNHDPNAATVDALNIRRNATTFVTVPEWRRGISVNPEDSPAAYALAQVRGHTVTIQASFASDDPRRSPVDIRAVDPVADPETGRGCLDFVRWILRSLLRGLYGNVLGETVPRSVSFDVNGNTGFVTFQLQNTKLDTALIRQAVTTWRWQYRQSRRDPWIDFETTTHRIYLVLGVPTAPWQQLPYEASNTQLPWTEALDYACSWATLKGNIVIAAAAVTKAVFRLAPGLLIFDCRYGETWYTNQYFFGLTSFIERLQGGPGRGYYASSSDVAAAVSTFANLLGCDLWQSTISGPTPFRLNYLLLMGFSEWHRGCEAEDELNFFNFHEVAWTGACTENDTLFDASLMVDGDADPTTAPHTALLPCNIRFGNPGDGAYGDRLCHPGWRPDCRPQPATRKRRIVL